MPRYRLVGEVTCKGEIEIEADSLEEAERMCNEADVVLTQIDQDFFTRGEFSDWDFDVDGEADD